MARDGVIQDDHHHHPLMLVVDVDQRPYRCFGCLEIGCGPRYACVEEDCDYVLHQPCANPDRTIAHSFFPGCSFSFLDVPKPDRRCYACGGDVNGFVYHCAAEGLDLHPCCAKLEHRKVVQVKEDCVAFDLHQTKDSKLSRMARDWVIRVDHHRHPLRLVVDQRPYRYRCRGCLEIGCGPRYACVEEDCDYVLHQPCANPDRTIAHPFFPRCSFSFFDVPKPRRRCDACGGDVKGFVYHCANKGWDLHPCCAKLERQVTEDGVVFDLREREIAKCYSCRKRKLNKEEKSWTYVSKCGEYHFHVSCMKKDAVEAVEAMEEGTHHGEGGAASTASFKVTESRALQERLPNYSIARRKDKKKMGKFAMLKTIVKFAVGIMAALLGDPITLTIALITSLISN